MKLLVCSDTHFEWLENQELTNLIINDRFPSADVAVLAGDIDNVENIFQTLKTFSEKYPEVIYVMGNHEYYATSPSRAHKVMNKISHRMPNVHWLHNSAVEIDSRRFVGTTLWFQPTVKTVMYSNFMNDYRAIQNFSSWEPKANAKSVDFLKQNLQPGDVLVTHHAPTYRSCAEQHRIYQSDNQLDIFYYTELSDLLLHKQTELCIHGHLHAALDYVVEGESSSFRVYTNPKGYPIHSQEKMLHEFYDRLILEI